MKEAGAASAWPVEQIVDRVDALPDGIVLTDASYAVRLINSVAARMLDLPDREQVLGRHLSEVVSVSNQDGVDWFTATHPDRILAITTGIPEQTWFLPSGEEVLITTKVHRSVALGPVDGLGLCLRHGRGRARLDRDRSDLVATIAHELRSPLTGVKGFVQALLNRWDKLSDDQRKLMLNTVNADAERLTGLIAELLDVARLDTGRLSLHRHGCDGELLVRRVVESVQTGTSRPIRLVVGEGLPQIDADPDKFTQVITNLVENGIRHGEGTVAVSVVAVPDGATPAAASGIRIDVDDEGEGIPEQIRARVFTKFWKHGIRGGTGLGLYLVGGLTKAHGGTVMIGDSPSGGARITVTWPAFNVD